MAFCLVSGRPYLGSKLGVLHCTACRDKLPLLKNIRGRIKKKKEDIKKQLAIKKEKESYKALED